MADNVKEFPGVTRLNHKVVLGCPHCDSRMFKLMQYGASKEITVRCANCEDKQAWLTVTENEE